MGNMFYTSDLHIGHRNIQKYRTNIDSTEHNTSWIETEWIRRVRKRDTIWCLGDNAFTEEGIDFLAGLPGTKIMIGGNHDDLPTSSYLRAFKEVYGCRSAKGLGWVTHIPMHEQEFHRRRANVHGHVHYNSIPDKRYVNVCCDNLWENTGSPLITLSQLRHTINTRVEPGDIKFYL